MASLTVVLARLQSARQCALTATCVSQLDHGDLAVGYKGNRGSLPVRHIVARAHRHVTPCVSRMVAFLVSRM